MWNWWLAALLVALQVPDILTTNRVLALGGRELNPVVRLAMRLGRFWWVPKMLVAVPAALFIAWSGDSDALWALAALCVVYAAVVGSNLVQIRRLKRRAAARAATGG